jgi:hypothetical protein
MAISLNTSLQNFQVDNWGTELNSGFIDIYSGAQPAANDAPTGDLLVSCALAADAYAAASSGTAAKSGTITGTAVDTGTAGYAQQRNAANTRWMYVPVSLTPGTNVVSLDSLSITINDVVTITTSTLTQPAT